MEGNHGDNKVDKNYCNQDLSLTFQHLKSISNDVLSMKHLRSLNLSSNLISEIPNQIKNLKSLLSLDLSHNKLEKLPQSLSEIAQLKYLNVSNNKFSDFPSVLLESLQFIRVLNLSHNNIKKLTDPPSCIHYLVELNLSHNELMKIPTWIFSAECIIKNFDISFNGLGCTTENFWRGNVPKQFAPKLQLLNLSNCGLTSENINFISNITSLETLKLTNHHIQNVKKCNYFDNLNCEIFEKCINLKHFHLSYCHISFLPNTFGCLKQIQYLNLEGNYLTWLPDSICDLLSLTICNLSKNLLCFLPKQFGKLTNLKELYLNYNNIADIPDCFHLLRKLEYCDMYGNKVEYVTSSIVDLESLKGIDLEKNCLDFHSICGDEDRYKKFISKYSIMKEHYRKRISENRCDLQMLGKDETIQDIEDYPRAPSPKEELNSFLTVEDREILQSGHLDEDWDADESNVTLLDMGHDDFDPNVNYDLMLKQRSSYKNKINESNFCPADSHIPSLRKYFIRKPQDVTIEGQYDLN